MSATNHTHRYRIDGMDCGSCALKVEAAARSVHGVSEARVSIVSRELAFTAEDIASVTKVESAVKAAGYGIVALTDTQLAEHHSPGYRKALWIVVVLNAGYGVVELVAGFVAGSQALKADALDFIGDGSITLLGLLALGWSKWSRAASALVQGIFLGLLGVGVLASTAYRLVVLNEPSAEMMGAFGLVALAVNAAAAAVLLRYRHGDANVRAVWLFSRNDALGNAAVVVAAALVAATGSPWPDLVVAVIIAALFLQSSQIIVRDARRELQEIDA